MAYHYTLINFVRQASNALLAEYFESKGIDLGIDHKGLKPRNFEPITDAIERLREDEQTEVNRDLQKVAALGDKAGVMQIVQEARFNSLDLATGLQIQKSLLDQAFWTYLKFPDLFHAAALFAVPYTRGRYWKRGITQDDYDRKARALKERQTEIELRIEQHQQGEGDYRTTLEALISVASRAAEIFERSKTEQRRELIAFVFSNLRLRGKRLEFSLRSPFDLMVNRASYTSWLGD
jgi:hypothetical protein